MFFCPTVTKNEEVKIIMVKHYRVGLDEKYEVTKKWSLNDLQMIDGKEADTVSVIFIRELWDQYAGGLVFNILLHVFLARAKCEDDILFLSGMV